MYIYTYIWCRGYQRDGGGVESRGAREQRAPEPRFYQTLNEAVWFRYYMGR